MTNSETAVSYTPEQASALALAATGLAGFAVSDSLRELMARMDRGELTEDAAAAEVRARFTQPPG
ncbi:hypothetical protein [Mycolicibacterium vinylchloridicum]|uniref:hypothetical protein n=1 Tax=Mycolicibacterium vinylchloridicum TaxID=2736928 RepID=UPI0015C877DA|nr:hypothetical protein [Mycolicibacterium vinylchloridicum]MBX9918606.1 hypothetical protein [Mycolicibacterium frederiksbergense]